MLKNILNDVLSLISLMLFGATLLVWVAILGVLWK